MPAFTLYGGYSYATVRPDDPDAEVFETVHEAASEWARRRTDWTGRFPCWGDSGPDELAVVIHDDTGDAVGGYTPRQLAYLYGPLAFGDLIHYYDPEDWTSD